MTLILTQHGMRMYGWLPLHSHTLLHCTEYICSVLFCSVASKLCRATDNLFEVDRDLLYSAFDFGLFVQITLECITYHFRFGNRVLFVIIVTHQSCCPIRCENVEKKKRKKSDVNNVRKENKEEEKEKENGRREVEQKHQIHN